MDTQQSFGLANILVWSQFRSVQSNLRSPDPLQGTENLLPLPLKPDRPKTPPPVRPPTPKVVANGRAVTHKEEPTLENLQAEIKELRMALELLQTRHE